MKSILTFFISVILGVVLFFGAVIGMSSSLVGEGSLPDATEITFEGLELTVNGYDWHLPLIGGVVDKVMDSASDLSVQKLGTVNTVQPTFTVPDWANYGEIIVTDDSGTEYFNGSITEYESFRYPANGDYKVSATFWHLPRVSDPDEQMTDFTENTVFAGFCLNSGLETPAQSTGYYTYNFRFTLSSTAILTLSDDTATVGSVVALQIDGIFEDNVPEISTTLGDVTALPYGDGYRAYIPIAYNATAGVYAIAVTIGDETFEQTLTVTAIDHEDVVLAEEEYSGTDSEKTEYQTEIWPLYDDESTEKAWESKWLWPVSDYTITVDYSNAKYYEEAFVGYSNSVIFAVEADSAVVAPTAGTVVYAGYLGLTGYTVVLDHGHGVRSYLYGLASISVSEGDVLAQNETIGTATETITYDVKIGNKSISPWPLVTGHGGMFY